MPKSKSKVTYTKTLLDDVFPEGQSEADQKETKDKARRFAAVNPHNGRDLCWFDTHR